jgi:RimJ/RimL family protein N-acetyltransferase
MPPLTPPPAPLVIRTERLALRPFRNEDGDSLTRLLEKLNDLSLFDSGGRRVSPARMSRKMIRESAARVEPGLRQLSLAVLPKRGRTLIGGARLSRDTSGEAEVGLWLSPERQAQGLGREALLALFRFGFEKLGCTAFHGSCAEENLASRRLMESCGMILQCTLVAEDSLGRRAKRFSYKLLSASPSRTDSPISLKLSR